MSEVQTWPRNLGNPGSSRSVALGCSCSPVLNCFGRGDGGLYKVAPGCTLHVNQQAPPPSGIRCERCGEVLHVIGEYTKRLACPNGCSRPELVEARRVAKPTGQRACERCGRPIGPARGRPAKIHEECLTPKEKAARQYKRDWARNGGTT